MQDAYEQGLLCRKALIDRENKLFVNGVELRLSEAIDEAYILCVTLDYYPAITHQVDVYLQKAPGDPFPDCALAYSILMSLLSISATRLNLCITYGRGLP